MGERERLAESAQGKPWRRWGPYLSERQWGTVREDYSPNGTAWDFFPHDEARSRAYRWGEDGLLGISDERGFLCFALALWNGADPILKERLFGLNGPQGNHGEDVKEVYFYLDNTPTHAYMRARYLYPQGAFPYQQLIDENQRRGRGAPEYEITDTDAFAEGRYFDVVIEYAKADPEDVVICVTVTNRGPDPAPLHLIPTWWFRNTWSWGPEAPRPALRAVGQGEVLATHAELGNYWVACGGAPSLLFTENESDARHLWNVPSRTAYVKDGINAAIVDGAAGTVNPDREGTKCGAHYTFQVAPGATETITLRLSAQRHAAPFADTASILADRRAEADAFYADVAGGMSAESAGIQRQAFAGLLWSKQLYLYEVERWLRGDPAMPAPPASRLHGRNSAWRHLNNADVIAMPDTWEYPWYAAWDLAFHCVPLALIDPEFAKHQILLLLREWYMHPNGQIPAYEWAFGDVNPPVHAWAAWRVYKIEQRLTGKGDRTFLERVFHKLLLNFTWWVNRKDSEGRNVFQGGFLGMDNIGVFDRTAGLPNGSQLEQSDGTAWMGMFSLKMLVIALELAQENPAYEDLATKFFEHFLYIAGALNNLGNAGIALWDETDEFFYDVLHLSNGEMQPVKVRSLVGLIPLLAVQVIEPELLAAVPHFTARLEWFLANRPDLAGLISHWHVTGTSERRLLALVRGHRMKRLLKRMLDPDEFLSDYGVRSISRDHAAHPYTLTLDGQDYRVDYEPAESTTGLFGGNSNWRGPIWFPINVLLIEALQQFDHYYGADFLVEHPTGSGQYRTLWQIADDLSRRLKAIFLRDGTGERPYLKGYPRQDAAFWGDSLLFFEYFHGDTGAGLGASHQTGWTAYIAKLLDQQSRFNEFRFDQIDTRSPAE